MHLVKNKSKTEIVVRPSRLLAATTSPKPLVYAGGTKGLRLVGFHLESIDLESGEFGIDDCLVHDETSRDLAGILSRVYWKEGLPQPFGIFYRKERAAYDVQVREQINVVIERSGKGSLKELLAEGDTWEVA